MQHTLKHFPSSKKKFKFFFKFFFNGKTIKNTYLTLRSTENRVEMTKMNYFVMPINNKYHCATGVYYESYVCLAGVTRFMAKTTAKSVTKARSCQTPNLVTFFAFLERCFENKLAGRTHSVYGQKYVKTSYKSKKSPKPNLVTFFAFFHNP
jgi:hypothetical protein